VSVIETESAVETESPPCVVVEPFGRVLYGVMDISIDRRGAGRNKERGVAHVGVVERRVGLLKKG
jgi:hypothetical protein